MILTFPMILLALLALIVLIAAIVLIRALAFPMPIPPATQVYLPEVDEMAVAEALSRAVRCQTVSVMNEAKDAKGAYNEFSQLQRELEALFPEVHRQLELEPVSTYSLLYRWQGSDASLRPALYMAHQDVVPVDAATLPEWEHPPFEGVIADGFVWGRGTLDIKSMVITELAAVEALLKGGFKPRRTLYLAFGHDEEIGGVDGACQIVSLLKGRGITLGAVLDEGGVVTTDALGEMPTPVAVIGTSEKGILTLELTVKVTPGHSSTPPKQTAIGILAKGLARLEANPMPARPEMVVPMVRHMGKNAPFMQRLALANLWLLKGVVVKMLSDSQTMNASIRTTTAITVIQGGVKDNVLPREAKAMVNFRLLPGDTVAGVIARVKAIVADERISVNEGSEYGSAASPISPDDDAPFITLADAIRDVFGSIPVAPYIMLGASDSRHYTAISEHVFRFIPAILPQAEVGRVHATNERISVANLRLMTQFFIHLMKKWDGAAF